MWYFTSDSLHGTDSGSAVLRYIRASAQVEDHGHGRDHRDGLAAEQRRRILPLPHGPDRLLLQQRMPAQDADVGYVPLLVHSHLQDRDARNPGAPREVRVDRIDSVD